MKAGSWSYDPSFRTLVPCHVGAPNFLSPTLLHHGFVFPFGRTLQIWPWGRCRATAHCCQGRAPVDPANLSWPGSSLGNLSDLPALRVRGLSILTSLLAPVASCRSRCWSPHQIARGFPSCGDCQLSASLFLAKHWNRFEWAQMLLQDSVAELKIDLPLVATCFFSRKQ